MYSMVCMVLIYLFYCDHFILAKVSPNFSVSISPTTAASLSTELPIMTSPVYNTKNISDQVDKKEELGNEEIAIYDYAESEFSFEDEALALKHIEADIRDFEDLKKSIVFLEAHINKHADINVMKTKELLEANAMLMNMNERVVLPYEQELKSLKTQILNLNHKFDNETMSEIIAVLENIEMFLDTSRERIEQVESRDQEWDVAEESAEIQEVFEHAEEKDNVVGELLTEVLKPAVTNEELKKTKTSENIPNQSISEAKSLFRKMKQMKMLKNNKEKEVEPIESLDEDDLDNPELHQLDEQSKVAAVKKVKESLQLEALSDLEGHEMSADSVDHYSEGVQNALNSAKEMSQKFMREKMHNHDTRIEDPGFVHNYLAVLALIGLVVVLGAALVAFRVVFSRKKVSRVSMQNLFGVVSSDKSYLELQSVKEDDGWGRNFSPWSDYKKKQYKFK